MPTPPTFVTGAVLTAAQMNTIGLFLVKSQTIGTGVSSVTVTGAFSADYDNYLITVSGGAGSTASPLSMQLGSKVTNYYYQLLYGNYANTPLAAGSTTATSFVFVGAYDANSISMNCTVMNPNLAKPTTVSATCNNGTSFSGNLTGYDATTTQYTAFTLIPASGTLTGGTIRVYGYRN